MSDIIYKYEVVPAASFISKMILPAYSDILVAHEQDDKIFIWVQHPEKNEFGQGNNNHQILTVPTGYPISKEICEGFMYLNTVFMKDGLVFHIYHRYVGWVEHGK